MRVRAGFVAAVLTLFAGKAFAAPPFQTDDPEPVPYRHFEFYAFSIGTAVRGDTQGEAPALSTEAGSGSV